MYSRLNILHRRSLLGDFFALSIVVATIYAVFLVISRWGGELRTAVPLDLSTHSLPLYAFYSIFRALVAYGLSFICAITFGYFAARTKLGESLILPLLDIGQSIPVLGFMPGLVLGLITIFPQSNLGLELACVIMIFTSQVWNMAFGFYASVKSVPQPLLEVAGNIGLSKWEQLKRIELPYGATSLAWNSLMSMAGGWFFLTVCEAFALDNNNFRLPGLGSYMAVAIEQGNRPAMLNGIIAMVCLILIMDFLVWRPIIAWTRKFRFDDQPTTMAADIPFITLLLKESFAVQRFLNWLRSWRRNSRSVQKRQPLKKTLIQRFGRRSIFTRLFQWATSPLLKKIANQMLITAITLFTFWAFTRIWELLRPLSFKDYLVILEGAFFTFLRVTAAVALSTAWAVPMGIAIGLSPRWTRYLQPVIQVLASFPSPMIYPIVLGFTSAIGLAHGVSAVLLLFLGVQWYVLFNVLAGAVGISDDLRNTLKLMGVSRWSRWKNLYFPSIFPHLVTGWVAAAGGAWNASIVAEYIMYKGDLLVTPGLGSLISQATASGNYHLLAGCILVMVGTVVGLNRTLWKRIYDLAHSRFRFES